MKVLKLLPVLALVAFIGQAQAGSVGQDGDLLAVGAADHFGAYQRVVAEQRPSHIVHPVLHQPVFEHAPAARFG